MLDSESGSEKSSEIEDLCSLCSEPVNKNADDVWKQVTGFVGGPKKDSMRLRKDTGYFAHDKCVAKISEGQPIDQPGLFDE